VPILQIPPEIIKSASKSGKINLEAKAWRFVAGLSWTLQKLSASRPIFPSWSWTGWAGPVDWGIDVDGTLQTSITIDPDIKLRIELRDGRILDWDTYQQFYGELNSPLYLTNYIRIRH
jgi:hypothetical protein